MAHDDQIAARKAQILEAAATVFADKGFHRATIHDVAQHAGIADGTMYRYFKSKDALLLALLEWSNDAENDEIEAAQAADQDIESFLRAYFRARLAEGEPAALNTTQVLISEVMFNRDLRRQYIDTILKPTESVAEDYVQKWVERGAVQTDNVPLTIRLATAMLLGALVLRIMEDDVIVAQWDTLPDKIVDLLLDGLRPKGNQP